MNQKIELKECSFESLSHKMLPGVTKYYCEKHNLHFKQNDPFFTDIGTIEDDVHLEDICVKENRYFKYQIITPKGLQEIKKVTFFFHGFNEKDWRKYLSWAQAICEGTGSAVVLFPIAFHMQRAPKYWSSKREMYKLSELRKKKFPYIVNSTLFNVAISMRLHSMPQRFIWSGLQTYYDVIQLIEECKSGKHPYISKDFNFDIFAYSIGGFLAQILKLTNYEGYFSDSKVGLFCSGATFNRLTPVSKFILDSETSVALYSFLVEHFDKMLAKDKVLNHHICEDHLEGKVFQSMLEYQKMRKFREDLLKKYAHQFYAITLSKDNVIPSFEVINTLKGAFRDIDIKVDEIDFDREYIHENPFPSDDNNMEQIRTDLALVFNKFCDFLNGKN